ncbi:MAG: prolipoprotein diacylglyceryl transferase [Candidatus Omnitrophica bacterium]|nr:prolipoprotein diacylglyceryl transferase [Candidatus Omnitrophota bacterium]
MHPVLLRLGPVTLYSYGLAIALGFLLAVNLAARRARAVGVDPAQIQRIALIGLLAGLAGGRAAYVFLNWDLYRANLIEILRLDHGGLVFYGGLVTSALASILAMRSAKLPVLATLDFFMPPLALAHAIGRIGCFLNGCCYGKPTDLPWGVLFPQDVVPRHPTQLYEAGALVGIFALLKRIEKRSLPAGSVMLAYGLLYGAWRFLVEFLRGDVPPVLFGLTVSQLASLPLAFAFGCALLLRTRHRRAK